MCGIAGIIDWSSPPSRTRVERMNSYQAHRGPDDEGIFVDGPVILGHRRLSVIDLSQAAHQPMMDSSQLFAITFNGEIYNYQEIRSELAVLGAKFETQSDTEVIVEGYKFLGPAILDKLNGMFAFAIWDRQKRVLFLARDRLGEKPLFYSLEANGNFIFASEIDALRHDPMISTSLNTRGLVQTLAQGYVLSSTSMIEGIQKLAAGTYLVISESGSHDPIQYWDSSTFFRMEKLACSLEEATATLQALLDDSVRLRRICDVPLGTFLSGGLDSSAVCASLRSQAFGPRISAFSIGFNEPSYSEIDFAEIVKKHLDVDFKQHCCIAPSMADLEQIFRHVGEPLFDNSIVPCFALAKLARQFVTVALSGDGADEIFAGYDTYRADSMHRHMSRLPSGLLRKALELYKNLKLRDFRKVSTDFKIIRFLSGCLLSSERAHYSWREVFSAEELTNSLVPEIANGVEEFHPIQDFLRFNRNVDTCNYLDRSQYVDIKTWLVDDILVKVDRTSMAHGLEVRCPFLDHRIVEFAARLPLEFKLQNGQGKRILKRSQRGRIPDVIISRQKRGFNAPVSNWLSSSSHDFLQLIMSSTPLREFVKHEAISKLCQEHISKRADNSYKLFALLSLHFWLCRR